MSSPPILSGDSTGSWKGFWNKPEGKGAMIFLAGLGGLVIWGWGSIVAFLVAMMIDTLHLVGLGIIFAATCWLLFSKASHRIFRVLMRRMTNIFISVYPIEKGANMKINIAGVSKAKVLATLYNASRPLGMGFLHYDKTPMTEEEAQQHLDHSTYFDYLKGRVMKLDLESDTELDARLYDRDNGEGAALIAVAAARRGNTTSPLIERIHETGKEVSAVDAKEFIKQETVSSGGVITLGGKESANHLGPAIDNALKK